MFLIFQFAVSSLKPLVVLPPTYGSNLYATYENPKLPWICPKKWVRQQIWCKVQYLIPPYQRCMFPLLTLHTDSNGTVSPPPNVTIEVPNWGNFDSMRHVHHISGKLGVGEVFNNFLDSAKVLGYEVGQNIFGATFDWRLMPTHNPSFYPRFRDLVEQAGEPTVLLGYSCGGYSAVHFLANHVTPEWKAKHISHLVLLAPSFGGTVLGLGKIFEGVLPFIYFYNLRYGPEMMRSWPSTYAHMPNHVVHGKDPVIIGPDGTKYLASDVQDLLVNHSIAKDNNVRMMRDASRILQDAPPDPKVPTFILYNSGIKTGRLLNFSRGWDKPPEYIPDRGDGSLTSDGAEWACNNWENVFCLDVNGTGSSFEHSALSGNQYVIDLLLNMVSTEKLPKGRSMTIGGSVPIKEN